MSLDMIIRGESGGVGAAAVESSLTTSSHSSASELAALSKASSAV